MTAFVLSFSASTAAQPRPTARLSVSRQPSARGCRDASALEAEVAARLGRSGVSRDAQREITVQIERESTTWRAVIALHEPNTQAPAQRVLESTTASCAELDAAIALAVTLAIDPEALALDTPRAAVPPTPSIAVTPRAQSPVSSATITPPIDAWNRGEVFALHALLALATVPVTGAFALGFEGPRRGRWRPWITATRTFAPNNGSAFSFLRTSVSAGACLGLADARWSGDLCASAHLGAITAIVQDTRMFEPLRPGDAPWVALGLAVRGGLRLWGPLSLELGASPLLSLVAQRFAIEGRANPVFSQAIVGIDLWTAVRGRF